MFKYNKRSNTIDNRIKLVDEYNPNYKPNNNQKNNSKDMLEIVIPGHYCSNDTINSKVKNIIRVIGPDRSRQGYWKTSDGKTMHESLILDSYTLLDTAATNGKPFSKGGGAVKKKSKNIMKDFKPIKSKFDDDDDDNDVQPYSRSIPEHLNPNKIVEQPQQPVIKQPTKIVDPFAETKKLLEKATIEQLNINYEKKYGVKPYKAEIITVPLKIEIPYHLEKLNQICEIFELDTKTVAQIIFENLRLPEEIILQILNDKLSNRILDMPTSDNVSTSEKNISKNIEAKVETEIESEEVQQGISEVDDYLKNMFGTK